MNFLLLLLKHMKQKSGELAVFKSCAKAIPECPANSSG